MRIRSKTLNNADFAQITPKSCSNFQPFVYTAIRHVVRKRISVQQYGGLVVKKTENFLHYVAKDFK